MRTTSVSVTAVAAEAPGKLLWLGEYAVLDGAPAIVCSVDRQVRATLLASSDTRSRVHATNLRSPPLEFEHDGRRLSWVNRPEELELAARVVDAAAEQGLLARAAPFEAQIDSSAFFSGQHKIGIGSSAAVAAALYRALLRLTETQAPPPAEAFAMLDALHRDFQSGRGSGVDIAAAVFGGLLEFGRGTPQQAAHATPLAAPGDLHWCAVFCGRSASTAGYLARLDEARARDGARISSVLKRLGELAVEGGQALRGGDAAAFVALVGPYAAGLTVLGELAGLDIVSREHRQLREIAAANQVAYKSSGAGGGDLGLGFATAAEPIEKFRDAARGAGFVPLAMAMAPPGRWADA